MSWWYYTVKKDPSWRGRPPQMLPPDVPVWHRWLAQHQDELEYVLYNFAITIQNPPNHLPDRIVSSWMYSAAVRIDAVAFTKEKKFLVIEVTQHAHLRCVGQIITYITLMRDIDPFQAEYIPLVVCETVNADTRYVLKKFNINIEEV
ncbi:MAG: hypothetical protein DRH57_04845 [Candidatus Cloacimonadota bacterium]|nr:MAG: hypothetical protein DRH57_04845 [Candidatus Cloacimonadota bacterium]